MKNIQDGIKACDKHVGTVNNTTTVKSTGQPYSAAAHHTLIAMWCAKNHCPFNSVLDEDYQAEVEMLHSGTILPGPQTVSHDINQNVKECLELFHGDVYSILMQLLLY
jgi:hypothetical protein